MSQVDPEPPDGEEDEELASTPFDNPWFLPILLAGMTLWFAYDGWLNADFARESARYLGFNRWGAGVLATGTALAVWRALRERRASTRQSPED